MLLKQILSSKSCWWPASEAFGCCGVQINNLIAVKSITLNQLQIPFNLNLEHNCSRTQKDEQKMASVVYKINLVKETWKMVRLKMLLLGFTNLSLWETNFMDHGTIVVGTRIFFNKFQGFRLKHFELVILMDTQFGCFNLVNWFCCQSTEKNLLGIFVLWLEGTLLCRIIPPPCKWVFCFHGGLYGKRKAPHSLKVAWVFMPHNAHGWGHYQNWACTCLSPCVPLFQ
jgi:hypothetical protein